MKRKPVKKIHKNIDDGVDIVHLTVKNRLSWEPLQQQWNLKTDGKKQRISEWHRLIEFQRIFSFPQPVVYAWSLEVVEANGLKVDGFFGFRFGVGTLTSGLMLRDPVIL